MKQQAGDTRSPWQIREHYEIEKELASKLRDASKEERRQLYSLVYDEMLTRVPHHPMLTRKASEEQRNESVRQQLVFLGRFLRDGMTFAEVGPGDCALALEVAKRAKVVYAIDVSSEITTRETLENFRLILSDGSSIPVPSDSVDLLYSNQLMEHLHPDDAHDQLGEIYRVLARGGAICVCYAQSPNRTA